MTDQQLGERLDRIEDLLQRLTHERVTQKYYSTADAALRLGRKEFTVREWCRHQRIHAEKRPCGRGNSQEWMISHDELVRYQAEGLLPPKHGL